MGLRDFMVLVALLGLLTSWGRSQPSSPGTDPSPASRPQQGRDAAASLDCPGGKEPAGEVIDYGGDSPGGPTTPEDAVAAHLRIDGLRVAVAELDVVASQEPAAPYEAAAQVVSEQAGGRLFSAYVVKAGDSWRIDYYFACQAWIDERT
jgi:hypothetical protein